MTAETTPMTADQINDRLREIAPAPEDARGLAKCLAVAALRRWHRHLAPFYFTDDENSRALERESVNSMCCEFATLHLLMAAINSRGSSVNELAAQITGAWDDGGEIGAWVWEHAQALGIDTAEVERLEDAWQALREREGAQSPKRVPARPGSRDARSIAMDENTGATETPVDTDEAVAVDSEQDEQDGAADGGEDENNDAAEPAVA